MAGKHGFLALLEILFAKDFSELRNGKIFCTQFAAIVVASIRKSNNKNEN